MTPQLIGVEPGFIVRRPPQYDVASNGFSLKPLWCAGRHRHEGCGPDQHRRECLEMKTFPELALWERNVPPYRLKDAELLRHPDPSRHIRGDSMHRHGPSRCGIGVGE